MAEEELEIEEFLQQLVGLTDKRLRKLEESVGSLRADLNMLKHSSGSVADLHKRVAETETQVKVLRSRKDNAVNASILRGLE